MLGNTSESVSCCTRSNIASPCLGSRPAIYTSTLILSGRYSAVWVMIPPPRLCPTNTIGSGCIYNPAYLVDIRRKGNHRQRGSVSTVTRQIRGNDRVTIFLQQRYCLVPAPCAMPCAVNENKSAHGRLPSVNRSLDESIDTAW